MSTLLIETLNLEPLEQEFTLKLNTRYVVGAIIPYLYMHNAPAGTFTLSILVNEVSVFSQDFTCDDIKASLDSINDYAHVFYPIVPATPLILEKGNFKVRLSADASYSAYSGFLAWVKQHEDLSNELDYVPSTDLENPLACRLKIMKQGILI